MPKRRRAKGPDLYDAAEDLRSAIAKTTWDTVDPRFSGIEYERLKKAVDAYERARKREQRAGRM